METRAWNIPELATPLYWPIAQRVVPSEDLFHARVADEDIARVFAVMALAQQHTFRIVTARPDRAQTLLATREYTRGPSGWLSFEDAVKNVAFNNRNNLLSSRKLRVLPNPDDLAWPLPNVSIATPDPTDPATDLPTLQEP